MSGILHLLHAVNDVVAAVQYVLNIPIAFHLEAKIFFLESSTTLFHYYGNIPLLSYWFILHFLRGSNDITRSVLRAIGDKTLSTSSSFSHTVNLQVVVSFNVIVREYWIKINPWVVLRLYKIFKIYVRFRDSSISCWYVSPCS